MLLMRPLTGLLLSLMLMFGSAVMAVSRTPVVGLAQIEICAGSGTTVITVDSQGKPVKPGHPCPACLAGLGATLPSDPICFALPQTARDLAPLVPPAVDAPVSIARPATARGPPLPV